MLSILSGQGPCSLDAGSHVAHVRWHSWLTSGGTATAAAHARAAARAASERRTWAGSGSEPEPEPEPTRGLGWWVSGPRACRAGAQRASGRGAGQGGDAWRCTPVTTTVARR
eukprot:2683259-Rhodomonas_salina.4